MVLKYQISKYPTLLEAMVVKIWEAQSDTIGAEVFTETIPERDAGGTPVPGGGHNAIYTLTANALDKVVHIVRLYSLSGTLLHQYNAEPKENIVVIFDPIQFKIGDGGTYTPLAGDSTYLNPILIGVEKYLIHRNNYGFLFEVQHYTKDTGAGSWDLIVDDVFGDDEEFTIQMQPQAVTTVVNDSVVAKYFAGFVDVSVATDYVNAHLRKLIRISGANVYTFTALGDQPPIGYGFCFNTFGSAGVAKIRFLNGQLLWAGVPKSEIDLPLYSDACFVWDGTNWNVVWLVQSTFINAATILPGTTIAAGLYSIGDVAPGDPVYTIIHNMDITGDYGVLLSIRSNDAALYYRDNKLGCSWYHDTNSAQKKNKFYVTLQELSGEVQNVSIFWTIIKL